MRKNKEIYNFSAFGWLISTLHRVFGPKRGLETWCFRKLLDGKLHILHYAPDIIKMIKLKNMGGRAMCH
jgi:hypothetical protein